MTGPTLDKSKLAYSTREAAQATGLSQDAIKRAIRSTSYTKWPLHLPAKKAGDANAENAPYVILARDLQSWLDSMPDA
jgi:hypothetical protein